MSTVIFKKGVGHFQGASFKVNHYINEPIHGKYCRLLCDIAEYQNWLCLNSNHNSCRAPRWLTHLAVLSPTAEPRAPGPAGPYAQTRAVCQVVLSKGQQRTQAQTSRVTNSMGFGVFVVFCLGLF